MRARVSKLLVLKSIFRKPAYILLFLFSSFVYWMIFYFIITESNYGIYFITVPSYMVYLLVLSSALLLTVGVYSIHLAVLRLKSSIYGGAIGSVTTLMGGLVASCGCSLSILGSLFYLLGVNSLETSTILLAIGSYQSVIIPIFIAINLIFTYYYTSKLSNECSTNKKLAHSVLG